MWPFNKPQLYCKSGIWYIRKRYFGEWEYMSNNSDIYWWTEEYAHRYCSFNSEEEARAALPFTKKL